MTAYMALALQTQCRTVNGCATVADARARMMDSIARLHRQIRASKAFLGADLRLVVLPEYVLTGYPLAETIPGWAEKAALAADGPEYARLGATCRELGIYLSGNAYEADAHFPGLYFQTSFVIDDRGAVVLRYRRLVSMFAPTPHDLWDRYLEIYGIDGVFPVADTPLGRLGCIASEEVLYPEIARTLALRGAEVLLHSTSEAGSPRLTPKDVAKRARAHENCAYLISANTAGLADCDLPAQSVDGMSKIVDYLGEVRAEAGFGESMVAAASIDLDSLRHHRQRPGMGNLLSRQRLECFRTTYSGTVHPANSLLDANGRPFIPERSHFVAMQQRVIASLRERGVLAPQ